MPVLHRENIYDCAVLTLNRPEVRNALNEALVSALESHLDDIESSSVRAVIITGSGKGFCAGTDLKEIQAMGKEKYALRIDRMQVLFRRLRNLKCPTIAAVHGPALGGGTELASVCTFRIADRNAVFGLPEIQLGVMPSYGGTQFVTRLIGESRALDLMLTGRAIDAKEALSMGLINRLVQPDQQLLSAALEFAAEFTGYSRIAQQAIRHSVAAVAGSTIEEGLAEERRQTDIAFGSEDAREGVAAFLEKRQAIFRDC